MLLSDLLKVKLHCLIEISRKSYEIPCKNFEISGKNSEIHRKNSEIRKRRYGSARFRLQ